LCNVLIAPRCPEKIHRMHILARSNS
jgi:hypothetical protein